MRSRSFSRVVFAAAIITIIPGMAAMAEVTCEPISYRDHGRVIHSRICWNYEDEQYGCSQDADRKRGRAPDPRSSGFAILALVIGGVFAARLIDRAKATWRERQLERINQQSISAQAAADRLLHGVIEADRLIQAHARAAYRRGAGV
jgi:hypothetical protein